MKKYCLLVAGGILTPNYLMAQDRVAETGYAIGKVFGLLLPILLVGLIIYFIVKPKSKKK